METLTTPRMVLDGREKGDESISILDKTTYELKPSSGST